MNIEYKFLQKAINDKNYISFSYENKSYKNIKPLKLDNENRLYSDKGVFEFEKIKKLMILRERF
jgi:predicted DNA-binding transcriptional regulator YafY